MEQHRPVLLKETLALWHGRPGGRYIDATIGAGGHSEALLKGDKNAVCLGVDRDADALAIAKKRLKSFGDRLTLVQGNFSELPEILARQGWDGADGILADLGVSSMQLDNASRGFSFRLQGPVDMRMDPTQGETALELIKRLPVSELARIIDRYGEERWAGPIAKALKNAESEGRLKDTAALSKTVEDVVRPRQRQAQRIHPATRTFQALRIAVNGELEALDTFLEVAPGLTTSGGRVAVISFHSLEDRKVKDAFRAWCKGCVCPPDFPKCVCGRQAEFRDLTRKAVGPQAREEGENPRSRSAKLRAVEKKQI